MTTTLNLSRTRGDTWPQGMTISNPDGTPMDLTNKQVLLTVNEEEEPTDTINQLFQVVGTITDATAGKVEFPLTAEQADNVGLFYFDVEVSDAANPIYLWTAEGKTAIDGSDGIYFSTGHVNDSFEYTEIDGIPVIRLLFSKADSGYYRTVHFSDWPEVDFNKNIRISGLLHMDESWYLNALEGAGPIGMYMQQFISNGPVDRKFTIEGYLANEYQRQTRVGDTSNHPGWTAGWVQWWAEWNSTTQTMTGSAWQPPGESEPVTPGVTGPSAPLEFPAVFKKTRFMMAPFWTGTVVTAEIAWMKYEVLS